MWLVGSLVPQAGVELGPSSEGAESYFGICAAEVSTKVPNPNYWTARKFPIL